MTTTQTPAPVQPVTTRRPALRVSTEWAVAYGSPSGDPNEAAGILQCDDEADAQEYLQWVRPGSFVARRTLIIGRWEQATEGATEPSGGLALIIAALDEAADDCAERAGTACRECAESAQRYCEGCQNLLDTAGQYRDLRDELIRVSRG